MNFLEHENNHLFKLNDKEEKKKEEKKKEEKGKVKKKHGSRSDKVPIGIVLLNSKFISLQEIN